MTDDTIDQYSNGLASQWLAAIVESSDDAIVSKDLCGVIQSWNQGAERLFGYTAEEAIGRPITLIIPRPRRHEEDFILGEIRRGERIAHFETERQRKDGSLVPVSLSVSPVRDPEGAIVGAAKIARDISQKKLDEERRDLLVRELHHRVQNLFTLAGGIVGFSARNADTPSEVAAIARDRLAALSRAQGLAMPRMGMQQAAASRLDLTDLIRTGIAPFQADGPAGPRITCGGPEIGISGDAVSALALLLHEFATNAAKHGALSTDNGTVTIEWTVRDGDLILTWTERGGPRVPGPPEKEGFGSQLARATISQQLGGKIDHSWRCDGVSIRLAVARDKLT